MLTTITAPASVTGVTAKSVADLGGSKPEWRTSAASVSGAIFVPATSYGGCAWKPYGAAGVHSGRSANPRTVAPIRCLAATGDDSTPNGVRPMALTRLFPSRILSDRAAAHRAMARAALFADTSTRTRLKRYNHHMSKARAFDAAAGKGGAA
jgi:hypothetical protein